MSEPVPEAAPGSAGDERRPPRADLADGAGWMVLGLAVLIGSVTMDRLESQNINPYTIPGLLPGLLGVAMLLLGMLLAARSWRRMASDAAPPATEADAREQRVRVLVVGALCLGYGVVLIGHGLPFWLASSIYVTGSILAVSRLSRDTDERRLGLRAWIKAVVIGVASSIVIQLVFQELFLVRMP